MDEECFLYSIFVSYLKTRALQNNLYHAEPRHQSDRLVLASVSNCSLEDFKQLLLQALIRQLADMVTHPFCKNL